MMSEYAVNVHVICGKRELLCEYAVATLLLTFDEN